MEESQQAKYDWNDKYSQEELKSEVLILLRRKAVSFNGILKILGCNSADLNYVLHQLKNKGVIEERN